MTRDPDIPAHFDTSGGVFHDRRYDRQRIEDATRRTITMPEHEITTHVEYSLIEGKYVVVLNPDADMLPSRVKLYLPRETSQALARDLAEQQAEADRRNEPEVEWAGRTFGQLTADEKARVTRQAAGQLQTELQAAAPAIAQVLDEADRTDRTAAVEQFLDEQLDRDDMTLAEIAAEAVAIATGASTYEPVEDEDDPAQ
jgi:hypothetical protein